jgi:hypothetical protein
MRCGLLAAVLIGFLLSSVAQAQRNPHEVEIPAGSQQRLVYRADLPPEVREALRERTQLDLKIGFVYRSSYLFVPGFDLWTWDGKYVLYEGRVYMEQDQAVLAQLIGHQAFRSLSPPWRYRFPLGTSLLGVVAIVLCIYGYARGSTARKIGKLYRNRHYLEALAKCRESLPAEIVHITSADRDAAIAVGVDFLKDRRVPAREAEENLRLLLAEADHQRACDYRFAAMEHEEAGRYEEAAENYLLAACLRRDWNTAEYETLLANIDRVRELQASAEEEQQE